MYYLILRVLTEDLEEGLISPWQFIELMEQAAREHESLRRRELGLDGHNPALNLPVPVPAHRRLAGI